MKIFSIAIKEIKQNLRNKRSISLMILFPIALIVILGAAFSEIMGQSSIDLGQTDVIYTIEGKGNISEGFSDLIKGLEGYNVKFTQTDDAEKAKASIQDSNYSCYILINENSKDIRLFKNERYNFNASFVEGILNTFVQRYNVINEVAKQNPSIISEIIKENNLKYISVESLDEKRQPRAVDYYGITMTTLIIMYASLTAGFGMNLEHTLKTGNRMLVSPVMKEEIFIGKVLGFLGITVLQIAIVVLFSKYVIKVQWGNHIGMIILVLSSEILMSVSIGIAVSFFTKSEAAMSGILNLIIPIMIFLGGGYTPLEQLNSSIINNIANASPIKWVNDSILNIIYRNDFGKFIPSIAINVSIAIILLIISSILFRREEV